MDKDELLKAFRKTAPVIMAALKVLTDFDADEAAKAAGPDAIESRKALRKEAFKQRAAAEFDMDDAVRYHASGTLHAWLFSDHTSELLGLSIGAGALTFTVAADLDPVLDKLVTESAPAETAKVDEELSNAPEPKAAPVDA